MNKRILISVAIAGFALAPLHANTEFLELGNGDNFAVLAATTVTNTGPSVIDRGDIGLSTGSSITGFPPGILAPPYTFQIANELSVQAKATLVMAYNYASAMVPTQNLTSQDLGGLTLAPLYANTGFLELGIAGNFALPAATKVTNREPSVITGGDIRLSPGSSITGFPPGILTPPYAFQIANELSLQAKAPRIRAYKYASGKVPTQNLTGHDLGGFTLARLHANTAFLELGTTGNLAIVAATTDKNTEPSVSAGGHIGLSPGSSNTGFLELGTTGNLAIVAATTLKNTEPSVSAGGHIGVSPGTSNPGFLELGTAGNFAVLAASTITNAGPSVIDGGHIGLSPGISITGFPPGFLTPPYTFQIANAFSFQARNDLIRAYNYASAMVPTQNLTGQDLGGLTLTPGVYSFSSSAQLTGTLNLDAQGDPEAQFVFQIGSTLITAIDSAVFTIHGSDKAGRNVYWQVGSSATIGMGTQFEGHIMALTSITMSTNANIIVGSALAINGAVTLDSNQITNMISIVPESTSIRLSLISAGLLLSLRTLKIFLSR